MIDYKTLLLKYIEIVGYAEGISFISEKYRIQGLFTNEEWEELERLDKHGLCSEPS